jgi:hypothetical protein
MQNHYLPANELDAKETIALIKAEGRKVLLPRLCGKNPFVNSRLMIW